LPQVNCQATGPGAKKGSKRINKKNYQNGPGSTGRRGKNPQDDIQGNAKKKTNKTTRAAKTGEPRLIAPDKNHNTRTQHEKVGLATFLAEKPHSTDRTGLCRPGDLKRAEFKRGRKKNSVGAFS